MLVPGLSGGSVAIALKIYDEILSRFSHFFKNIKNNFFYFLQLIIGGLLGMFISSITLLKLLNINYYLIISIVLGLMSFIILKNFNYNNVNDSIKALNDTAQACQVDMQKDKDLICD